MTTPKLVFTLNGSRLAPSQYPLITDFIESNPYGTCTHFVDDSEEGSPKVFDYSAPALMETLTADSNWNLTLYEKTRDRDIGIDLLQKARGLTLSVRVAIPGLDTHYLPFYDYAKSWATRLPAVSSGYLYDAHSDLVGLYRRHHLEQPPSCFTTHLRWVHFLGSAYYQLFLTEEDLLNTPAYSVNVLSENLVEVKMFKNPFESSTPDTLDRLAKVTAYLNEKDRFMMDQ